MGLTVSAAGGVQVTTWDNAMPHPHFRCHARAVDLPSGISAGSVVGSSKLIARNQAEAALRRRMAEAVPGVDRRLGQWCGCSLIECCHNEDTDEGDRWRVPGGSPSCRGAHHHGGSPVSGHTQPWERSDESWR